MIKYGILLSVLFAVGLAVVCPPQGVYKTKSTSGCRDYVQCKDGKMTVETCSAFLKLFNPATLACDWCWKVNCSAPATPWPAPTTRTPSTSQAPPSSQAPLSSQAPPSSQPTPSKQPPTRLPTGATSVLPKSTAPPQTHVPATSPKPAGTSKKASVATPSSVPSKATPEVPSTTKTATVTGQTSMIDSVNHKDAKKQLNSVSSEPGFWSRAKHYIGGLF